MISRDLDVLIGPIVECEVSYTVEELGELCAADAAFIRGLAEEGVLPIAPGAARERRFSGEALRRARIALRLQRDLELNLAGVALALDLLDEIATLRRRLGVDR